MALTKEEKTKLTTSKRRVSAYKAKLIAKLEKSPKIRIKFQNIESPGTPLEFNFHGIRQYALHDGYEYDLPVMVIDELMKLSTPVYKQYDPDELVNKLRSEPADPSERIVGSKNRFSIMPVGSMASLTKKVKQPTIDAPTDDVTKQINT